MFPIRNVEDLQKLNEAVSLESQVKVARLQDKLSEQNYHQQKIYISQLLIEKNTSENLTKTITNHLV